MAQVEGDVKGKALIWRWSQGFWRSAAQAGQGSQTLDLRPGGYYNKFVKG